MLVTVMVGRDEAGRLSEFCVGRDSVHGDCVLWRDLCVFDLCDKVVLCISGMLGVCRLTMCLGTVLGPASRMGMWSITRLKLLRRMTIA